MIVLHGGAYCIGASNKFLIKTRIFVCVQSLTKYEESFDEVALRKAPVIK